MNKKSIIWFLMIILIVTIVTSTQLNTFSNLLTTGNLSFSSNQNNVTYLNITKGANITSAYLNISALEGNNSFCYQEFSNVSTSCGGLATGLYSISSFGNGGGNNAPIDGNWSSYGESDSEFTSYSYINYSRIGNNYGTVWQVKDYNGTGDYINNFTISNNCLITDKLQLRLMYRQTPSLTQYYCYNLTDWELITDRNQSTSTYRLYEESIYWNKDSLITNPSLDISNDSIKEWWLKDAEYIGNYAFLRKLNDTSIVFNLTFTGNQNQTLYLNIPKNANVTNAILNLSGYTINSSGECYQESATTSNSCGGLSTGSYSTTPNYFYINYTKPNITFSNLYISKWEVKFGWDGSKAYLENITISSGCWNYDSNKVILRLLGKNCMGTSETCSSYGECYDGSWNIITSTSSNLVEAGEGTGTNSVSTSNYNDGNWNTYSSYDDDIYNIWNTPASNFADPTDLAKYSFLYEEAIIWNITYSSTSNLNFSIQNNQIFYNNNNYSTLNNKTNDFSSNINSYLSTCTPDSNNNCQIPLTFHSDTAGILKISDIQINYTNISKTNDFSSKLNLAINSSNCNCNGCLLVGNYCQIPFVFHSDTAGILNYSNLLIDYFTIPTISLSSPTDNLVSYNIVNFTCIANDEETPLVNATLKIWNSTNGLYQSNTTNVTGTTNITTWTNINFTYTDTFHWSCEVRNNDSILDTTTNNTLIIIEGVPIINQFNPLNDSYKNNNSITFNCSILGSALDTSFLYGSFNGSWSINQSKTAVSGDNIFNLTLPDSTYTYTCAVNQTTGVLTTGQQGNFTFTVDTVKPIMNNLTLTTTIGSQTFTFNTSITDTYLNNCYYTVFNLAGGIDGTANHTFTCNTEQSQTTSSFATYLLKVYANDLAGNLNEQNLSFTTSASSGGTVTGGGGGGTPTSVCNLSSNTQILFSNGAKSYQFVASPSEERTNQYLQAFNGQSEKITINNVELISDDMSKNWFTNINKPSSVGIGGTEKISFNLNIPPDQAEGNYATIIRTSISSSTCSKNVDFIVKIKVSNFLGDLVGNWDKVFSDIGYTLGFLLIFLITISLSGYYFFIVKKKDFLFSAITSILITLILLFIYIWLI